MSGTEASGDEENSCSGRRGVRMQDADGEPVVVLERMVEIMEGPSAGAGEGGDVMSVTVVNDGGSVNEGRSCGGGEAADEPTGLESMLMKVQGKVEGLKELVVEFEEADEDDTERKRRERKGLKAIARIVREGVEAERRRLEEDCQRDALVAAAEQRVEVAESEVKKWKEEVKLARRVAVAEAKRAGALKDKLEAVSAEVEGLKRKVADETMMEVADEGEAVDEEA